MTLNFKRKNKNMNTEKVSSENETSNGILGAVSGSLSIDDCKWLIFYGQNKDKTIDIRSDDKGELDYVITQMFQLLKDSTRFDSKRVERVFWERVTALVNYR